MTIPSNYIENIGSQARDFCMLERNLLSHLKLALLLCILSWSVLLQARLVPEKPEDKGQSGGIPMSAVEYGTALTCIIAGCWEYYQGYWDLRKSTAFLRAPKLHLIMMGVIGMIVMGTCIVLVVGE